jgi:hypothetical protein
MVVPPLLTTAPDPAGMTHAAGLGALWRHVARRCSFVEEGLYEGSRAVMENR